MTTGKPAHVWSGVRKIEAETLKLLSPGRRKHPWGYRCPAPMCFFSVSAKSEKDAAHHQDSHPCPWFGGGTTTLDWGAMSSSFIEPIWKMLDACMDSIMEALPETDESQRAKYEARGIAKTLAVLMPPFFHHADEVAREAKLRYDKRKAGEDYETHGVGRLRYKPPGVTLTMVAAERPAVNPVASKLGEKERAAIKSALSVPGMFTEADLAKVYGVSEAAIRAVMAGG